MNYSITYVQNGVTVTTKKDDYAVSFTPSVEGVRNKLTIKASRDIKLIKATITYDYEFKEWDSFFCNGYQSCTDTKEFGIDEKMNNLHQVPSMVQKLYSFKSYGDIAFYDYKKNTLHGHDVGYIRGAESVFIGNNNITFAGLIIEFLTKENKIVLNDDLNEYPVKENEEVTIFDYDFQPFKELSDITYFNKWVPRTSKKLLGYSSWYNHFDKINEEIINKNLDAVTDAYDLFQLDDGYESKVGDWLICDPVKFPNGLKPVVDKCKQKHVMPGIWIAPFVAQEGSKLIEDHPDWLKIVDGQPVKCGCNWGGFYALDFYNKEVQAYIKSVLSYYKNLGFEFFKLDFLYAVSLPLYEGKNRSQVACEAYRFLRECLGDSLILGNSAVMAPAFGVFDYVRVGCSVTTEWDDSWLMRHMHRERNSTKTAILNTVYRSIFNGKVFMNDPDVFLLRDENMKMTPDQKYSLAMINALFGSVLMTSDDIANYDTNKKGTFDSIVDIAKHAKYPKYRKNGDNVEINYFLNGKTKNFTYNSITGTLREVEERY